MSRRSAGHSKDVSRPSQDADSPALEQFMSVTGTTRDIAVPLLEACSGNVQMAVDLFLDGGGGSSSAAMDTPHNTPHDTPHNTAVTPHASASFQPTSPDVRAPIPQVTEVMLDESHRVPAYRTSNRRRDNNSVFDSLRDFQAETRDFVQGESSEKKRTLQELFRPPIDIIFRGTFRSASIFAEKQNRWLLVNVQNSQEFACQMLNRDVWSLYSVKDYVKNKFVFWQGYHDSTDGSQYIQYYQIHNWPHIAILDPRTVKDFISDNPSLDPTQVVQNGYIEIDNANENILDSSEDQQLMEAIRLSLQGQPPGVNIHGKNSTEPVAGPSIVIGISDDDEEDFEVETFTSDDDSRSSLVFQQQKVAGLKTSFQNIKEEPSSSAERIPEIALNGPTVTLQFRFPNGEKKQLTLPKASQLQALIDNTESNNYSSDKFELITTFPRRKLSEMDPSRTLLDIGLDSQEVIYVQSL